MILVHDIFICKPGNASKMAKLFKEVMKDRKEFVSVLTDMTGEFNKVVMVSKFASLEAYEKSWEEFMKDEKERKKMEESMAGYHEMYQEGRREIYREW